MSIPGRMPCPFVYPLLFVLLIFTIGIPSLNAIIPLDFPGLKLPLDKLEKPVERSVGGRRLIDSVAGKKSIFSRDHQLDGEDQYIVELARKLREEKEQQRDEVRFLRDEAPGKRETEEEGEGEEGEQQQQNEFGQSRFDPHFPVHNLCGPWNSGKQANNLEWAEPADKLLKLLNSVGKQRYNLFMAPGQLTGHATNVSIAMYIESMSSFKAQTMDFEVDMYFAMGWYDRRLAHNCTHPLLVTHKPIAERIWTPDLYFLNAKFAYLQEVTTPNFMVIVYPDGLVFKTLRIDVTLSCNMDLQLFPFDKQECPMVIQSFAYIESMLNLSWHVDPPLYPIATNPELKLNDMAITGMRFERCSSPYTMFRGTGVWSCLRGYIVMKRLVLFHLIQTYIPSAMLVSISWMTFWLDPRASPARISLTITSLLTLTTMSNGARQDLPQVSYIKAMDIWQNFSQALIFLVLLEYSFVSYYFTRRIFQCAHRRHRWSVREQQQKRQPQTPMTMIMRQMATEEEEDVRLGNIGAGTEEVNNNNDVHVMMLNHYRPEERANLIRRRRHSAEPNQQNSAILATAPPAGMNGQPGGQRRPGGRRLLCSQPSSDFYMAAGIGGGHGMEEGAEEEVEEADNGNGMETERPCQKCQLADQRRARTIDRYSRLLFPAIFVCFCALYWLYYLHIMAEQ